MPPIAPSSPRRRTLCRERSRNSLRSARKNGVFSPFAHANGLVAQLEERLNGIEEVVSSNLIGSTNFQKPPGKPRGDFVRLTATESDSCEEARQRPTATGRDRRSPEKPGVCARICARPHPSISLARCACIVRDILHLLQHDHVPHKPPFCGGYPGPSPGTRSRCDCLDLVDTGHPHRE